MAPSPAAQTLRQPWLFYAYDGHDRLYRTYFPSPTTSGTSSATDYEQLGYENTASGTRTSGFVATWRNRSGQNIGFTWDNLGRLRAKNLPSPEVNVSYRYDNFGRLKLASQGTHSLTFSYDALGRQLSAVGPQGTVGYQYDLAGRRTRLTYPGSGLYVDYDYLVTGEVTKIRENGATSGVGVLATYAYDNLGRRTSLTRGNGTSTSYSYDNASRLSQLVENLSGTTHDLTLGFSYNPAGQIVQNTRSNDLFSYTAHSNVNRTDTINGLNQVTATGGTSVSHDTRGNITAIGAASYGYTSENLMTSAPGSATLAYDPLMRLYQTTGGATTRFAYDGATMIAEYDGANALQRRFVHGPGVDEPLVWYEGTGTSDRRFLHADERGSVVAVSNSSGTVTSVNRYDEYGVPASTNVGRFQYTGQAWLPEAGLYYYRARIYNPSLGRFMQTDPIGYAGGMNLYAYVGNDPVNFTDPLGLYDEDDPCRTQPQTCAPTVPPGDEIYICPPNSRLVFGGRCVWNDNIFGMALAYGGFNSGRGEGGSGSGAGHDYQFRRDLNRERTRCTADQVKDVVSMYAVPGNDGTRVQNNQTYTVSQRVSVLVPFLNVPISVDIPAGRVRVNILNEGNTIINTTLPGHIFHSGTVTLNISPGGFGKFSIDVIGRGLNSNWLTGVANDIIGPPAFDLQVMKMQATLRNMCGG